MKIVISRNWPSSSNRAKSYGNDCFLRPIGVRFGAKAAESCFWAMVEWSQLDTPTCSLLTSSLNSVFRDPRLSHLLDLFEIATTSVEVLLWVNCGLARKNRTRQSSQYSRVR